MKKNILFKTLLIVQTLVLLSYTLVVFKIEGVNLFSIFIKNIQLYNWSGQFSLDLLCYLILSAFWIMWRNKFNLKSILLGIFAMLLGILFFAPYLLWLVNKENGDLKLVLFGDR